MTQVERIGEIVSLYLRHGWLLFEVARNKGYDCDYRALRSADLIAAQGVWLVSSITLAARVHTLDGKLLPAAPLADEFAELVDAAILSDR